MEALMNCRPLLSTKDAAFVEKWRWRLAICYSAILLSIVLGIVVRSDAAKQGFSAAAIGTDHPHPR
jgi:hypothetical protein